MKNLLVALLLSPSLAMAQNVTHEQSTSHEQIERMYKICDAGARYPMPRELAVNPNVAPVWSDPDLAKACPKVWVKWKAHKDELNSQKAKEDLKAFSNSLK